MICQASRWIYGARPLLSPIIGEPAWGAATPLWRCARTGGNLAPGFWTGVTADSFDLYRHTAAAIKRVDPGIPVGGPATGGNAWIPETVAFLPYKRCSPGLRLNASLSRRQGFLGLE